MLKGKDQKQKMILTFDYELALGNDSGTINKCIIEPVKIILDLMKKYSAKGIFFVDASFLLYLKKTKDDSIKIIKKQLKDILKNGNDIGLHIHPQWMDAYKLDNTRWSFKNLKHYRLNSLKEKELEDQFKNGIKLLNELIENRKYKIRCFRAGGWTIQPFNKIKKQFVKNRIIYDFSVNPGLYNNNENSYFNFRIAPKNLSFYRFENDPCIVNEKGMFFEIPVTTVKVKKLSLWLNHYLFKRNDKIYGDGKFMINDKNKKNNIVFKIIDNIFKTCYSAVSIDGLSNIYFKIFLNKIKNNLQFYTFVCHPKMLSKESYKNLETVLRNYSTMSIDDLDGITG